MAATEVRLSAAVSIDELTSDDAFVSWWGDLKIPERNALSPEVRAAGLARYNKIMGPVRTLKAPDADASWFDRGERGVPRGTAGARGSTSQPLASWPQPLDLEALAEREPSQPRFIVPDWGPIGYAWMLAGHGGAGKSLLALTLAVCIAAGRDFLGLPVQRSRVLLLSCEDRENVLHWRLARICAFLDVDLATLRGWLEIVDLVGRDSILWAQDPRTGYTITAAYGALAELMRAQETQVLVVDGITDTFGGNENSRVEVKRYVNALLALVPADSGALMLVGHVNKNAAGAGGGSEGYSGSTAWHNAVRARWYLYPETKPSDDGDRAERTGNLLLELQKSNLGRADLAVSLAWDDEAHVFAPRVDGTGYTNLDRLARENDEQAAIMLALRACHAKAYVPAAQTGPRTALHVLSAAQEFPDTLRAGKPAARRFWRHVEALRHRGDIVDGVHRGQDRHTVKTLVPGDSAGNANART